MDNQPLNIFSFFKTIVILIITCTVLVVAAILVRRKARYRHQIQAVEQENCCLKRKAERLGLVLYEVPGGTLYSAVEDQLCHLNHNGTYTQTILRKRSKDYQSKRKTSHNDMESFQHLANMYNRNIEIIHSDSFGSTVFRPADCPIQRPMQTLYVGCDRRGRYYSLRPVTESPAFKQNENRNALTHQKGLMPTENDIEDANSDSTSTQTNFMIGGNSNVLIGDNSNQYVVVHMPTADGQEEYVESRNIVIGEGNTQNVVATFRTAKELLKFMNEMREQQKEFSEPALRLKIRIKSSTLTEEQLAEKEARLIELLNDDESETRQNLEPLLNNFGVSFQNALQGCIKIELLPQSNESFFDFVNSFQGGDIIGVIACLCSTKKLFEQQNLHVDVMLSLRVKVDIRRKTNREVAQAGSDVEILDDKYEGEVSAKSPEVSRGISLLFSKTSENNRQEMDITGFPEQVVSTALQNKEAGNLCEGISELDIRLEPFCSKQDDVLKTPLPIHEENDRILQVVRGNIGVVRTGKGVIGTCFRIGPSYVMTAYHVIKHVLLEEGTAVSIDVDFPDANVICGSRMVFCSTDLDVAVLKLYTDLPDQTNISVAECRPGLPIYLVGYKGPSELPTQHCERSVIEMPSSLLTSSVLNFHSLAFEHGASGSPGVIVTGNKVCYVTMLQGAMISKNGVTNYGVKLSDIYNQILKVKRLKASLCTLSYTSPFWEKQDNGKRMLFMVFVILSVKCKLLAKQCLMPRRCKKRCKIIIPRLVKVCAEMCSISQEFVETTKTNRNL